MYTLDVVANTHRIDTSRATHQSYVNNRCAIMKFIMSLD